MKRTKTLLACILLILSIIPNTYGQYDAYRIQVSGTMDLDAAAVFGTKASFKPYLTPGVGIFFLTSDVFRFGTGIGLTKRVLYGEDIVPKTTTDFYFGPSPQFKQDITFLSIPLYFNFLTLAEKNMSGGFCVGLINNIIIHQYNTWGALDPDIDTRYYQNGVVKKNDINNNRAHISNYNLFFMNGYFIDFDLNDQTYFSINPNLQFGFISGQNINFDLSLGIQGRIGIRLFKLNDSENNGSKAKIIKVKL